jgi:Mrp family chromosome partitioning ATPase
MDPGAAVHARTPDIHRTGEQLAESVDKSTTLTRGRHAAAGRSARPLATICRYLGRHTYGRILRIGVASAGFDKRKRSLPTIHSAARGDGFVAEVIAIANQKGGVGKTTCAINLAGALAEQEYRILCIDMDAQANLTVGLGINLGTVEHSMADVLADSRASMREVVVPTQTAGIDVAPSTLELASTEVELFTAIGREHALREALDEFRSRELRLRAHRRPPTLGLLTINGLVAADSDHPRPDAVLRVEGPHGAGQGHQPDPSQGPQPRPARARSAADVL